jgi:hypothetical protein
MKEKKNTNPYPIPCQNLNKLILDHFGALQTQKYAF